jgi:cytochrome c oxidase subunit 4
MSTTTTAADRLPEQPHGHSEPTPHHTVNYLMIFMYLVILTAATFGVSFYRFSSEFINVLLAMIVASTKASLVVLFFMHVKFEGKLIRAMLVVPLCLCVILVLALIPDIFMTDPVRNAASASLHLFNPITAFFHGFGG